MKAGDVILGTLTGAVKTKVRPAVVIASATYLSERPDVIVGILTTRIPVPLASTDYVLHDWHAAGLRTRSCFRVYALTLHRSNVSVIGRLSTRDWTQVKSRVRTAFVH